ncbi:hypothetical protein PUN28_019239 [Cardiocondyla obscurior]|uniref:CHK kinase-like domain-containing protein n=1 Tax=Cardiocondyla obscurior TaxID=286306 RepID=A0AAW2EEB2_9HYME
MMSHTLNKMNELLGPKHLVSAKGLHAQKNPTLLIIEDLAPLGFRMADRLSGLDLTHSIMALHGLARFHAASVALCEKVDFQLCLYTSPAIDLLYFLSTSPSPDVIENKKSVLLNEYLSTLSATMKQLGCKTQPPTMEKLNAMLKERASYGMIASFTVLPIVLCCKTEAKDLDEIMSSGTFVNPGLKSENYKKLMSKRLLQYDEIGLLDL